MIKLKDISSQKRTEDFSLENINILFDTCVENFVRNGRK